MTQDSVIARRRAWRERKRKMNLMPFAHQPTDEERRLLMTAAELIAAFRALDPKIPSSYMAGFIAVALNPGGGPTKYSQDIDTIQPIASRILQEIGQRGRFGDSLRLVDQRPHPANGRCSQYFLTTKGQVLMSRILDILRKGAASQPSRTGSVT